MLGAVCLKGKPADVITGALGQLIAARFELPGYSTELPGEFRTMKPCTLRCRVLVKPKLFGLVWCYVSQSRVQPNLIVS